VAVLVLVMLSALAAAVLLHRAQAEVTAAAAAGRGQQAYATAMAGLQRTMAILSVAGADQGVWTDNPDLFAARWVCNDGANDWYFTIYAYNPVEPKVLRNGVTDEASKININTAGDETLLALGGMTPELVDALLDYRDADANTRPQGAEQDYYDQLPHPYLIKNGPLMTVEELLLVKGFNVALVYGEDYNLNGLLEPGEDDGETTFPPDNGDGQLDRGLLGMATTWSYERNVAAGGSKRININANPGGQSPGGDPNAAGLSPQTQEFIRLYRLEGNVFKHPADLLNLRYQLKGDQGNLKAGQWIESGVGADELPRIVDRLTAQPDNIVFGKVNINTAPAAVLAALPGFDEDLAGQIVSAREQLDAPLKETIAWPYTQNVVPADTFKAIAPLLTARSWQFHVRCVAYGWPCGQYRVVEAVIDMAAGSPRILYQRDLTRLGLPFAIDVKREQTQR
jgi:DNA uptake protein ComE-like DNA-binding protein